MIHFHNSRWPRLQVILGGVFHNLVYAAVAYASLSFLQGGAQSFSITAVAEDSVFAGKVEVGDVLINAHLGPGLAYSY